MDDFIIEELAEYGIKVVSEEPLEIAMIDDPKSIAIGELAELLVFTLLYDEDEDLIDQLCDDDFDEANDELIEYANDEEAEEPYWDNAYPDEEFYGNYGKYNGPYDEDRPY